MLEPIIIVLLILWVLGAVGGVAFGGLIHALLVIAVVLILVRLVTGREDSC